MENQPDLDKAARAEKTTATINMEQQALHMNWSDDQIEAAQRVIDAKFEEATMSPIGAELVDEHDARENEATPASDSEPIKLVTEEKTRENLQKLAMDEFLMRKDD